jgi:hypothetical protein
MFISVGGESMSVLVVDYGAINHLNSTATSLARKFQKRVDDNEGIIKGVNSLPTSRNNLDNANYFIKKKNEQYHSKINKLNAFQTRMNSFSDQAESADKRVAKRIIQETKVFKKANNIKVNPLVVIGNAIKTVCFPWTQTPLGRGIENWIEKGVRDTKNAIKDWYKNGGKFIINIVKTVVVAAVLVTITVLTLGTGAAAFFGILSLALLAINTASTVYYNIKAYQNRDNRIEAERLSEKSGFEMVGALGKAADRTFKTNIFEKTLCTVFVVASVVDFGYGVYKLGTALKTEFKNLKLAKNYAKRNGAFAGVKHFFKKSYTSVNKNFTRENTMKFLTQYRKTFKNSSLNYFHIRKAIKFLKPYKYYNQVINNYTLIPKYEKGKKIAKRVIDVIKDDLNIKFSSIPKINMHPIIGMPSYNNIINVR